MSETDSALRLEQVSFRPSAQASFSLSGINASFHTGRVVAVVGPNGAGKTTLLRVLAGLVQPNSGQVLQLSDGEQPQPYPAEARDRARLVHYLAAESTSVFDFTVEQVVAMGRYPHRGRSGNLASDDLARVKDALYRTHIGDLAHRSILTLSSGEQRRTWIARALVSEARFLLLDEPTANLDLAHALELHALVRELASQGHGVVLAVHDLEAAYQVADEIVLINQGKIEAQGSPSEVLTENNIAHVFGVRFTTIDGNGGLGHSRIEVVRDLHDDYR